jgi:peptidoglycan/xylan/chitin deacetylase (PgdA/CDA1 family)
MTTIALTFDHDATSKEVLRGAGPVPISHGEYGPRVGLWRVLRLLASYDIRSTFFVPVHTALTYPDGVRAIIDAGHEIGCHGWAHENLALLKGRDQRDLLLRCRAALAEIWGRDVSGFRAPFWQLSTKTLEIVEELGFVYDSSLMADDFVPYRVRHNDVHDVAVSSPGDPGKLVEVPVSWALDDWPYFEPSSAAPGPGPMVAPSHVLGVWTSELRWLHANEPGGLFTLTMHPEAIGRASRIQVLEGFIQAALELGDVRFDRLDAAVDGWLAAGGVERAAV